MPPDSPDKRDVPPPAAAAEADPMVGLLRECDEHVRDLNLARLRQDLDLIQKRLAAVGLDEARRRGYRSLIARLDLFRPHAPLGKYEGRLYDTLIALAFDGPVGYEALCLVEDYQRKPRDAPLYGPLLAAIDRAGTADLRSRVIVYASLDPKKLGKWLVSPGVDAFGLLSELACGAWRRQEHGRLFCDVTLQYLQDRQGRYSSAEVRRVLARNGYLAQSLREVGHDQYQVYALTKLLVAAFPEDQYPSGLDEKIISELLANTPDTPTPALLAAILRKIPEALAPLAWGAYVYGSVARMDLDDATHGALWTRLPPIEPEPEPVTGPPGDI